MCSKIGNSWRCASICSLMSSPSGVKGNGGNGPPMEFTAENVCQSLNAAQTSSYPVTATTPWCDS